MQPLVAKVRTHQRLLTSALIVGAILVTAHTTTRAYRHVTLSQSQFATGRSYTRGQTIKDTSDLDLGRAHLSLLIFTASLCRYCTESMPFYRRLTEEARKSGTRVIAIAMEPLDVNRQYLLANGIRTDAVVSASKNSIEVRASPTLILLRSSGAVVGSWQGFLSAAAQQEVLRELNRASQ